MCVCVLNEREMGPIYSLGGRFPPNASMEGDQCLGCDSSSKCTWMGLWPGSADLWGRSTPHGHDSSLSSSGGLTHGLSTLSFHASSVAPRLLCQVGPPREYVTPDAIFCVVTWRLHRVFFFFRSSSFENMETPK